jgi:hypothetical protein
VKRCSNSSQQIPKSRVIGTAQCNVFKHFRVVICFMYHLPSNMLSTIIVTIMVCTQIISLLQGCAD